MEEEGSSVEEEESEKGYRESEDFLDSYEKQTNKRTNNS